MSYFDTSKSLPISRVQRSEQRRDLSSYNKTAADLIENFIVNVFGNKDKTSQKWKGAHKLELNPVYHPPKR